MDLAGILELRPLRYTWTKVSALLGISRATLYRRLEKAGISPHDSSHMSDQELDELISCIKQDHPNDGEVLVQSHLHRMGMRAP